MAVTSWQRIAGWLVLGALAVALSLGAPSRAARVAAQAGSRIIHTQDVALFVQLRAADDTGATADITDQLLALADAMAGSPTALGSGFTFTPAPSITGTAINGAGKPMPNVVIDFGVLSGPLADGSTARVFAGVSSADVSQGLPNLGMDSLVGMDLSGIPAVAAGPTDVSFALLQALPPDDHGTENGLSNLAILASRWQAGKVQAAGATGDDGTMQPAVAYQVPFATPPQAASAAYLAGGRQYLGWKTVAAAPAANPQPNPPPGVVPALVRGAANLFGNLTDWTNALNKAPATPQYVQTVNDSCGQIKAANGQGGAAGALTYDTCFYGSITAATNYHHPDGQVGHSHSTAVFRFGVRNGVVTGTGEFGTDFSLQVIINGGTVTTCTAQRVSGGLKVSGSYSPPANYDSPGSVSLKFDVVQPPIALLNCTGPQGSNSRPIPATYWNAWNFLPASMQARDGGQGTAEVDTSQPSVDPNDYDTPDYPGTITVMLRAPGALSPP